MSKKEVVYIDIEDDITGVIEKATSSDAPITALVLPKRFAVLQSLVNMKLLKKAVDKVDKKVVLITSEAGLLPVAGAAAIHVAETLQSRPAIPEVEDSMPELDDVIDETDNEPLDTAQTVEEAALKNKPSKSSAASKKSGKKNSAEPLVVDGEELEDTPSKAAKSKDKDHKIPNFNDFKTRIIIGIAIVVVLIVGWILAYVVLPSAQISIKAQTTRIETDLDVTLDPNAGSDNIEQKVLRAETKDVKKTVSEKFDATGEKDVGKKSSGTIQVTNYCFNPGTLPSGTVFTSASGLKFVSTEAVTVANGINIFGECQETNANVPVSAQDSGDKYNLAPTGYTVGGYSSSDVSGFGQQMSGGTSEIAKVVSQADVDNAAKKLMEKKEDTIVDELKSQFKDSFYLFEGTYKAKAGAAVSSPAVGEKANDGQVNIEFTYTVTGVERESLVKILETEQLKKVSSPDQSILENGLNDATIQINGNTPAVANIKTNGFAGPEINTAALAEEIKGKRYGKVIEIVKAKEGVREVEADFSPFWVFSAPRRTSKINITIEVSDHTLQ